MPSAWFAVFGGHVHVSPSPAAGRPRATVIERARRKQMRRRGRYGQPSAIALSGPECGTSAGSGLGCTHGGIERGGTSWRCVHGVTGQESAPSVRVGEKRER